MSDNLENKTIEAPNSGESQSSKEDLPVSPAESAATTPSVAVSEELMAKIVDLCAKNSEAAINLNNRLNDLSQKLGGIKDEMEANKPLRFEGEVTGFYNFDKREKEIVDDYHLSQKEHAKKLFAKARSKYPNT